MYYSSSGSRPSPSRRSRWPRRLAIFIVAVVAVIWLHSLLTHHPAKTTTTTKTATTSKSTATTIRNQAQLDSSLKTIFADYPQIKVGMAVIDITSGSAPGPIATFGQTTPFVAASTNKVLCAVDFLQQVEAGKYKLTNNLGSATAAWQLQQMIQESNNDSWAAFINLMGRPQMQAFAEKNGITSYKANGNLIDPADQARLLEKLYKGQLLNAEHTKLLLSYMQHTNDETLIPAAIPSGVTVYHKYGELLAGDDDGYGNIVHDVAIISDHGHNFVLTIYTNRVDELDITDRQALFHSITKAVLASEAS